MGIGVQLGLTPPAKANAGKATAAAPMQSIASVRAQFPDGLMRG